MKTFIASVGRIGCLIVLNLLIFNNLAISQGCTALPPRNFLGNTVLASTFGVNPTMVLTWDTASAATGGYRIEVFDVSLGRRHFETNVSQSTNTLNVSLVAGRRYLASIRSICGVGTASRLSYATAPASGGRIIIDDVIFLCATTCPANTNYTNALAGNSLSWSSAAVWGAAATEKNNRSRALYLQIKPAAAAAGVAGEKFRIRRDDNNQAVVGYSEGSDVCSNDANISCQIIGGALVCADGADPEILRITFGENDVINFTVDPGYVVRYQGKTCTLPALSTNPNDPNGPGEEVFEAQDKAESRSDLRVQKLNCSPNPVADVLEINFELLDDESVSLEIYTPLGVLLETVSAPGKRFAGENSMHFNVGNLPIGSYFVVLRGETWQSAARFEKI